MNANAELLAASLALLSSVRRDLARFEAEFAKDRGSMLWAVRVDAKRARLVELEAQVAALGKRS